VKKDKRWKMIRKDGGSEHLHLKLLPPGMFSFQKPWSCWQPISSWISPPLPHPMVPASPSCPQSSLFRGLKETPRYDPFIRSRFCLSALFLLGFSALEISCADYFNFYNKKIYNNFLLEAYVAWNTNFNSFFV
jgi:hypothetical protein